MKKKNSKNQQAALSLSNLKAPLGSHKRKKILGRGSSSGHGKTSTRGSKGQTSRSGKHKYLGFEGGQSPLIRKIPKRGFTSRSKVGYQIVHLADISKIKEERIGLDLLESRGIIKDAKRPVKILSDGEIKGPVTIQAHAVSKKALDKIKSAGGAVELMNV
ncbi:MAG: 50S ribosomal protein L15 [Candidatus Omnitrophica bacterium]|nr:50S ribosomal protein L15 [Candidatus Omnitrophota bacterium]MDD5553288.1 50S ribosomal protein L15 [Candidatus Omnitrophota bacterium]